MLEVGATGLKQHCDVLVVELVVDVAPVAPVANHASRTQQSQCLADTGVRCVECCGDVADALLATIQEQVQDLDTTRVAEQPEHVRQLVRHRGHHPLCRYLHSHEDMQVNQSLQPPQPSH